ncbi:oligopeptide transport system permease protein AppC [Reticulibacter mediterranei]|uniref:Oligopeptide transport system permease protein AppC n=1 Tax=Reticulibacter mediterranei TaxID=2778369 RepID=A0A8J3MZD4_9CHLR|nr:ABC transporter permease [Reticulibacter mediterranei]GHO91792.1 oligopeptide transport system permease protein AppC [Reticulibacter mediterranei]
MDIPGRVDNTIASIEDEPMLELTPALTQKRRSQGRIIFDRFIRNKAALVGLAALILLFLFCFLGPFVTGHSRPDVLHPTDAALAPSWQYPFGTDDVGRDQFARAMAGGQVSLLVGLISMLVALIFGIGIGSIAGYFGGIIDNILMRLTDIMLSVPYLLLLFVLSASFSDGSPRTVILLIALLGWATTSRLVRGEFIALKQREFVLAARTIGAGDFRLMFRHILPNAAGPIIVNATLLIGINIISESVLSYFNFGLHPPSASWGNMVSGGQALYDTAPWLVFAPALLIFVTVLSCNLVGDGLRDALDPHMTER